MSLSASLVLSDKFHWRVEIDEQVQVFVHRCSASLADLWRSCDADNSCGYDLCVHCCREIAPPASHASVRN